MQDMCKELAARSRSGRRESQNKRESQSEGGDHHHHPHDASPDSEKPYDGPAAAAEDDTETIKVGIFFCGPPVIGKQLADRCESMTARGRAEGKKIEYFFMMEVFG